MQIEQLSLLRMPRNSKTVLAGRIFSEFCCREPDGKDTREKGFHMALLILNIGFSDANFWAFDVSGFLSPFAESDRKVVSP
jgi:hypothetical protein